jgi:hypothetical protein
LDRELSDEELIRADATRLGITRLCHLTPLRNLVHIASGEGLLSVTQLEAERAAFDQQDLNRYDNHPDYLSCSIEYPNVWYLRSRRREATPLQRLFPEWVCLLIDPKYLWSPKTQFCARNASAGGGEFLRPGYLAFRDLYADQILGAQGAARGRDRKPQSTPTDDQAEIMIQREIPLQDARTIVFADEEQASNNWGALRLLGVQEDSFKSLIAPDFFDVRLSSILRSGGIPAETPWTGPQGDATD